MCFVMSMQEYPSVTPNEMCRPKTVDFSKMIGWLFELDILGTEVLVFLFTRSHFLLFHFVC